MQYSEQLILEQDTENANTNGTYSLIRSMDRSVRKISDDLYNFRRETGFRFSTLEKDVAYIKKDNQEQKTKTAIFQNGLSEVKSELKN